MISRSYRTVMVGHYLTKLYDLILRSELSVWAERMTSCSTRHAIALHESVLGRFALLCAWF